METCHGGGWTAAIKYAIGGARKIMDSFAVKKTNRLLNGDYLFDLGQNASGIPFIKLKGKKGDTVRIIPAELINEDGSVNQKASGKPFYFLYILEVVLKFVKPLSIFFVVYKYMQY